ncbi:hypothetical protein [Novosphingobium sp. Chol11]|uniref:hypothetical protein n=1 Tax=Novosphingobium sp. Chol11 TaxID=1385763 RepID=UPI0025D58CEB|nr:hypothetical protein [Novosphingobium sp. Chol11]
MLRIIVALFLMLMCAVPAAAQQVTTRTWVDANGTTWTETTTTEWTTAGSERLVAAPSAASRTKGIARFGPFAVLDSGRAALVDETDTASPAAFQRMLRAFPGIRVLEMVDCPGTVDDTANLALGRMIRAHGLATAIPPGGSVRSGAVELFLAGAARHAAPDAEFAVHSWRDDDGREPGDFAATDPVNAAYTRYYREMGLSPRQAAAFYALTNSVAHDQVLVLHTGDIAPYAALDQSPL